MNRGYWGCRTCKWAKKLDKPLFGRQLFECRRFPPTVFESDCQFPGVDAGDWCGEYTEKEEADAE